VQNSDAIPFNLSYRPNPEAIYQRVGSDVIIINLKNDRIYSLNKTAGRFWELLMAEMTIPEIKKQLVVEFEVDRESLNREIQIVLNNLVQEGLIVENLE